MTTSTDRIEEIFRDARELQADALEIPPKGGLAKRSRSRP